MEKPEKTRILWAHLVAGAEPDAMEVVGLANHEHVVDHFRDRLRDREDETRAIGRLVGAFKGQSVLAAVFRMVEEVEHYRDLQRESPVLDDRGREIDILESVPSSMPDPGLWEKRGELRRDDLDHPLAIAICHPGVLGLIFVTDNAWECHEDARRCET